MKIEYQITDSSFSNSDLLNEIHNIEKYGFITKVATLPAYIKYIKSKNKSINLSSMIDFPFGSCSTDNRLNMIKESIKDGAGSIEIVMPTYLINNTQNAKIKKDIQECYNVCSDNGVSLHYVLEYRQYNYSCLSRLVKLLLAVSLNDIYLSTGFRLDNIYDHLIAISMILKENPEANLICNANIYNEEHLTLLKSSKIEHFRINNPYILDLISKKYQF